MHRASLREILVAILAIACTARMAPAQDFRVHLAEEADSSADESQQSEDTTYESPFGFASMLYQPPPTLQETVPQPTARRGATGARQSGIRLASVPNMYGDQGGNVPVTGMVELPGRQQTFQSAFTLPTAQGSRSAKMAENDTPIPVDRVFFNYNHFHNLFELRQQPDFPPGPETVRQQSIDRYTVGFEKTFFDGLASVELRMPFIGTYDADLLTTGVDGGNFGNLAVVLKGLVYEDGVTAVGAGMAVSTPTGSDTVGRFGNFRLRFHNEAVHLLPYVGFIVAPGDPTWGWNDGLFFTGFAQLDIAANGNTVDFIDPSGFGTPIGKFTEQNLLYLDAGVGYWLYRDPYAYRCTGIAAVGEIHYTTSVQDSDLITQGDITIGSTDGRFDIVNGTIGLQFLLFDLSSLRIAGVFPLGDEHERFFDSEVQVQFNRRF